MVSINEMINRMPKQLQENERIVLRKIGSIVRGKVVQFLHNSDVELRQNRLCRQIMMVAGHTSI